MRVLTSLILAFVLFPQTIMAQTHTIVLNTGLTGQTGTSLIGLYQNDDDWRVIADPLIPHPVPRPALVVDSNGPGRMKWPSTLANSRWISGAGDKYNRLLPLSTKAQVHSTGFMYRTCFTLPSLFVQPKLALQIRADDAVSSVAVNYSTILFAVNGPNPFASSTTPGSFLGPPLILSDTNAAHFHAGQNCIDIAITDLESMVSGLNVAGTMTYQSWPPAACTLPGQIIDFDLSTGTDFAGAKIPLGSADLKWRLAAVPTGNPGPAYSTKSVAPWVSNAPQAANWIQRKASAAAQLDDPNVYTYQSLLPPLNLSLYSSVRLIMRYAADDSAIVRLNGNQIDSCNASCFGAWRTIPQFNVTALTDLKIDVNNSVNYTGLIVDAKLRATCK